LAIFRNNNARSRKIPGRLHPNDDNVAQARGPKQSTESPIFEASFWSENGVSCSHERNKIGDSVLWSEDSSKIGGELPTAGLKRLKKCNNISFLILKSSHLQRMYDYSNMVFYRTLI
jgi:hypothetical protein